MRTKPNRLSLNQLSIHKRLPLLICTLLLSAIVIYGFANYYSLKKASLLIGRERLSSLTGQFSSMFGTSAQSIIKIVETTAAQKEITQYLETGGNAYQKEALNALDKLHRDSSYVSIELLNTELVPILKSDKSSIEIKENIKSLASALHVGHDLGKVGRIYNVKGVLYYPVIAAVTDKKSITGYIIFWKLLQANPKSVAQLSQLVGTGAGFYIGNTDGSIWTDLVKQVKNVPSDATKNHKALEYTGTDGLRMLANVQPIAHTDWLIMVSFPEHVVLKGMIDFVKWSVIIGLVLMAVGAFAAWVTSHNITRPLNQLTATAAAISQGDYAVSSSGDLYRNDEFGQLARVFDLMTNQVFRMHQDLEKKVAERTSQLENVNRELEAFSYSVSHDLRTPLRAINGYSIMLKEDYDEKLDDEGRRIIRNILTNAKMMGQLIDDLLAFSRLGKKDLAFANVDMKMLAKTVVDELLTLEPGNKYSVAISSLPPANADPTMIKQVWMNLLSNAIKYSSKKDRPEIEIGFKEGESGVTYYVKDNGAGFDMAYSNKLFGVFQRLHSQDEFEGSGVGLALVKRIIEKHKGEIIAEAAEGKGATFYFRF